jgi:arylsulfatase A-like enzyme
MRYINTLFVLLFLLFTGCNGKKASRSGEGPDWQKPNILFICVDDLRPELGCCGKDHMRTPNIDKLAESGMVFTNHFVQVPTCGASRFSLLTGMLPETTAHLSNQACREFISGKPESDVPETFIHHLRCNGYYTLGIGKISHYVDGLLYGYTDPVGTEYELPHSWDEMLFDPGTWGTGWNAFFGYASGENRQSMNRQVRPYENAPVGDTGYPDGLSANLAIEKLGELAQKSKPFFLGVGFFKPHLPFNAPEKYWDLYDEYDIPLSPNPFIPKNIHKASLHGSGEFNGYQLGDEKASLAGPVSGDYARKLKHAYFACISYIDAQIGKLLVRLEELGLADNTIVVIWGDHGWHLGDHLVWGKHTVFERALKSAFVVKLPGNAEGRVVDKVVSSVDIYPTIMELCGIAMPHQTDGHSLVNLLHPTGKINSAGRTNPEGRINPDLTDWEEASYGYYRNGISLRTERYRMTKYFRDQEPVIELYDHVSDPNETKNIAGEHPDLVERLMPLWEKGNTGLYE